uniref:Major facilitator superfamily (MFS) profile domain-containing protein n=1 Tax=Strigamia maritima TaxID=126957 RepID=T1JBE0_STRMM
MVATDFAKTQKTIFSLLFIGYANYAYNRKSVSMAFPALMDAGLSKNDAGLIASSQNLAFAISKFLGGILSDRVSARILFSSGLFLSGAVTILYASSTSLSTQVLLWFLNGIGQGAGWPAAAKVIRHWSSPDQFGTWWSVISASTNVSGAITPFLAIYLILNYGWPASLVFAGSLSVGLSVICLLYVVDSPTELGWNSFATESKKDLKLASTDTWRDIIKSPFLWLLSICYMVVYCVKTSAVDWGQMYLHDDLNQSQYVGSAFTSSLETGGFVGGVASGYITDWLMSRPHNPNRSPRMPIAFAFTVGLAIGLHVFIFWVNETSTQLFITSTGFWLGACMYGSISIFGVVAAETTPPHLSGTAHAVVALAANMGGVMAGLPFSLIAKYHNWGAVFILLEVISVITALIMLVCWNIHGRVEKLKNE